VKQTGNDGQKLKKIMSCDGCKYLSDSRILFGNYPYKCYQDDILKTKLNSYDLMNGDIEKSKTTPDFCPYLMKKLRNEKIKELKKI